MRPRFPSGAERVYRRLLLNRLATLQTSALRTDEAPRTVTALRTDVGETGRVLRILSVISRTPPVPLDELGRVAGLVDAQTLADLERLLGTDPWWARSGGRLAATQWVQDNVGWIRSIEGRYLDEVAAAVLQHATDPEQLAAVLEERYGVAQSRARLIARDQVGTLHSQLSDRHAAATGLSEYIWRTRRDGKVRPEHAAREGKVYRRGQLAEEPGQAIACRCVREWVARTVPVPTRRAVPAGRLRVR